MNVLQNRAPLTHQGQALESSRDSGFDLSAAVGEPVDNSWEAGATSVRIGTIKDKDGSVIDIAISDNGGGIPLDILPNVLSFGYSSRYNSRTGLGRFGMGLKLAAISQGRRAEVYTRPRGETTIYRTVMDLDDVKSGKQQDLFVEEIGSWPKDFEYLMREPETDDAFAHGTLVVWRKVDRLRRGGHYGEGVDQRMSDLTKFLARAYRRFIDAGLYVELEGRHVTLHDPLFLLSNPRVIKKFGKDVRAKVIQQDEFVIDGHKVRWTVSLLPEELRRKQGGGGRRGKGSEDFKDLYIPDNEGKINLLRNGREIYYDVIPRMLPLGLDIVDRYIGVEVSFPAELDEYFQVRNVKRGAEPIAKLREEIRNALKKPIKKISGGIDLLLLAYAKAENMHSDPEDVYGELRSHWGLFTGGLVREFVRNG